MRPFLAELRRRNVYKVGAAYAVVGWILLQAASMLLPAFDAPGWVFKVVALLVILGFPLALVFAWAFELTPEGLKRTHEVPHEHSITHLTGRRLDFTIIGLLVLALGISLYLNVDKTDGGAKSSASIAVLPFTNRSTDPSHAMFADGVHDELLTSLANIGSLKVISRTSVMEYRDTTKNLREIGKELAVATVLEGAVQRIGDNVRINVQLIDAATDQHLWANTYDRRLTTDNLFAIQTEIATAIARKLKATLTPGEKERIEKVPTQNLQAYNLYLAGRQNLYQRKLESLQVARQLFAQSISIDPGFAKAYSALSDTLNILYSNFAALEPDAVLAQSQPLLDKALAIDPDDADIQASLGLLASTRWDLTQSPADLAAAEQGFQRAIEINPNHAQAVSWYAGQELFRGDYPHAIELYQRALQLDPLARVSQLNLGDSYAGSGDNRKALDIWLECARTNPDWPGALENISVHLLFLGRLDEALAWATKTRSLTADTSSARPAIFAYGSFGAMDRVVALVNETPRDHPFWLARQAVVQRTRGDVAGALALVEDAIRQSEYPPPPYFVLAADLALRNGKFASVQQYLERVCPDLARAPPNFDDFGFCNAPAYAVALRRLDQAGRADQVLQAYLKYTASRPRLGLKGFGIGDVEALTLLGRHEEALARLREAVDAGWRTSWPQDGRTIADDPYLASIHDDTRFRAMVTEVEVDIDRMRKRAAQAEASGDWQPLLSAAAQGTGRVAADAGT